MKYAVTSDEMKICDRNTSEHFGIDSAILMERAALKICDRIDEWKNSKKVNRAMNCLVTEPVQQDCLFRGDTVLMSAFLEITQGVRIFCLSS